jgi:DNA-binding transcriptional LysR family regulator
MDRIDAMKVFVAAIDEGSLTGAGRKLGRSPSSSNMSARSSCIARPGRSG